MVHLTLTRTKFLNLMTLDQTWANYGPPVRLFWPAGTYTILNSYRDLSGRPLFPLEIMDGSDFQKNKPHPCKIEIKNEVKTFYFGDHVRTLTVISKKKKVFTLFSNQRAARGFNSFSTSDFSCKKLAYPCSS